MKHISDMCLSYSDYLNSSEWKEKRDKRLELDGYRCQTCGECFNLHVHHKTYDHIYAEDVEHDLITLCGDCHKAVTDSIRERSHPMNTPQRKQQRVWQRWINNFKEGEWEKYWERRYADYEIVTKDKVR